MKTLICISTGQPLANLIPVLHFKPEKVLLIATDSFKSKASVFRDMVRNIEQNPDGRPGISVQMINGCPDTGIADITRFIEEKVIPHVTDASQTTVNLTGGTKQHSFVIYQMLADKTADVFYVDTQNRHLEHYPRPGHPPFTEMLPSILTIENTLKGMGKRRIEAESDSKSWQEAVLKRKPLTDFMIDHIGNLQQLIGQLNAIIGSAYKDKSLYKQAKSVDLFSMPRGVESKVLEQGNALGIVKWNGGKRLDFESYHQARYFSGNWMEEYAWLCALQIGFEQLACNVRFANLTHNPSENMAPNEIDLLAVHANAMLAVECKAATKARQSDVSQDMFHKLSGVAHRAGGLMCSKLFLSAFPLTFKSGQDIPSLYHAKEQDIHILQYEDLKKLPELLALWRDKARFS
jgi:hypothetical protein